MEETHMTISNHNDSEVRRRMNTLQVDNLGIAYRILYKSIVKYVIPQVNKAFRTTKLPPRLDEIEKEFERKLHRPRSIYKYDVLDKAVRAYENIPDIPYTNGPQLIEDYSHPWRKSERYVFDDTLKRNKRALKKAAGLPKFGKKRDQIADALQFVDSVYSQPAALDKLYSIMPGYRTQQSPIDDPKVRLTHIIPVSQWAAECFCFDNGITRTIEANRKDDNEIKLFYDTPENIQTWYDHWNGEVIDWVNADATQYDVTVRAAELSACIQYFGGDCEFLDNVEDYIISADIVMPYGDIKRRGGMPSGSKITNLGDGWTNVADVLEAFERLKLRKFIKCIILNGDDISVEMATKVDTKTLDKFDRYSRRNVNPGKSKIGGFLWNSKWYIEGELRTRPVYRVLNSLMFKEHQINPITGSKEYVAIATAQQLQDIEQHPLSDLVYRLIAKIDKYPISQLSDAQLVEAAEAYVDDHNWNVDWVSDPATMIRDLKKSRYAEIAG